MVFRLASARFCIKLSVEVVPHMGTTAFIEHKGKTILFVNFAGQDLDQISLSID